MSEERTIHVGIGFATGRKNFLRVLRTYIDNWLESGLTEKEHVHLHVFIAYDLLYNNTKQTDFTRVGSEIRGQVEQIHFVDAAYVQDEKEALTGKGVLTEEEANQFFGSGYASMRNAILYAAVQNRMDYLLFLDDDEYPLAVTRAHDVALWSGQRVLAKHLEYIADADITNGYHCGYISPIPFMQFNETLKEKDFRAFIEAISNDIISWDKMARLMRQGGVTYADTAVLIGNTVTEVQEVNHCKFLSGSNLCLNLTDVTRTIPFYNPPGARGEDTFLSTCLQDRKVLRIPCYAFHNGFSTYNYLLSGVLPTSLKPIIADSRHVITRFYNACAGWVRYKPLLLYITQRDTYQEKMADMRSKLQQTLPKISANFAMREFLQISEELDRYDRDVETHYRQFLSIRRIWETLSAYLTDKR